MLTVVCFIALTYANDHYQNQPVYVNANLVGYVTKSNEGDSTYLQFIDRYVDVVVKETPEEIIEKIKNCKE